MAVDERRRSQLYEGLASVVGEEAAATMFELLPPAGTDLATSEDVARLEAATSADIARLEASMDHRFAQVDRRFADVDRRLDGLERRLEEGLEGIRRELSELRGEVVQAVSGQTRAMTMGVVTAVVGIGGLAYTFGQVL